MHAVGRRDTDAPDTDAPTLRRSDDPAGPAGPAAHRLLECAMYAANCRQRGTKRSMPMKNPLESIWGTIISGVVLTAVLYVVVAKILM
jgi:hypothetical protein